MKKILFFLFVLLLTGCSKDFEILSNDLDNLRGCNQNELFMALGIPDSKIPLDDENIVYIWSNQHSGILFLTSTPVPYTTVCTIKYIVKDGVADFWEVNGNETSCEPYINSLNKYKSKNHIQSAVKTQ